MSTVLRRLGRPATTASVRAVPLRSKSTYIFNRLLPLADQPQGSSLLPRFYATTTKGDTASSSNLGTPSPKPSDSPEEGDIKSKRAQEGRAPQESGSSVAQPVNQENESNASQDEEGTDPMKSDPSKPAEQKKKETLKEGEKSLDPADK